MKEDGNQDNNTTQYIRSRNMGNTMDNKQRHSKEEDPMSPDYTNSPIGDDAQENISNAGEATGNSKEGDVSSNG